MNLIVSLEGGLKLAQNGERVPQSFPGAALVDMVLAINLLGDWLRDAPNPKLQ